MDRVQIEIKTSPKLRHVLKKRCSGTKMDRKLLSKSMKDTYEAVYY